MPGEDSNRGNPYRIEGFAGIDNVSREDALAEGAVRKAENVDIHASGKVQRRAGRTLLRSGTRIHSLTPFGGHGIWAEGETLLRDRPPFASPSTLRAGIRAGAMISYAEVDDRLYWSNGVDAGVIVDGEDSPWHLTPPVGPPILSSGPSGSLRAGRYQVTCSFRRSDGLESGAPGPALVSVSDQSAISLSAIPQPPAGEGVTSVELYVSEADGTDVKWARSVPVGTTAATISKLQLAEPCETLFCEPMPPGHLVAFMNGRLFVASGSVIWYSEPLNPGLTKIHENYLSYASRITLLQPAGEADASGLYISDGARVYWLSGADPEESQQTVRYPSGAIEGSMTVAGSDLGFEFANPVAVWVSTNGRVMAGLPNGQIQPLNERAVTDPYERAAPLYREKEGIRQVLFALRGQMGSSAFKATDTAVASVHSNAAASDGIELGDALTELVS